MMDDRNDSSICDSTNEGWSSEANALIEDESDKLAFMEAGDMLMNISKAFLFERFMNEAGEITSEMDMLLDHIEGGAVKDYLPIMLAGLLKCASEASIAPSVTMDIMFEKMWQRHQIYSSPIEVPVENISPLVVPVENISSLEISKPIMLDVPPDGTEEYFEYMDKTLRKFQHEVDMFNELYVKGEDTPPIWLADHMKGVLNKIDYIEKSIENPDEHGGS